MRVERHTRILHVGIVGVYTIARFAEVVVRPTPASAFYEVVRCAEKIQVAAFEAEAVTPVARIRSGPILFEIVPALSSFA